MISERKLTLLGILAGLSPAVSVAADAAVGQVKAEPCLACHFADDFVDEAEQDVLALIQATRAPDSAHPPHPSDLDDDDMADIAAFFAQGDISSAADADAGRVKAEPCLACHFADDFLGEAEPDILALIHATQAPDSTHPPRPNTLDNDDIADIAAFFARGE